MEIQDSNWASNHLDFSENREPVIEKEKDANGFRQFVDDLKDHLMINEKQLTPSEVNDFDENIKTWMDAVTGDRDLEKRRDLKEVVGMIKIDDGKRTAEILPGFTKKAKDLDENCSRNSRIYSVALALAKLEMIEKLMGDVYPSLESKAAQYKKYLNDLKEEIINPTEELDTESVSRSLAGDTFRLSKRVLVPVVATMIMTSILLSGCGGKPPEVLAAPAIVPQSGEVMQVAPQVSSESESDLPTAEHVQEPLAGGGTSIVVEEPNRSDYVPGTEATASFEPFVTGDELSGDGVTFTSIKNLDELKTKDEGQFVYVTRTVNEQGVIIYQIDLFTKYDVAAFAATKVSEMNLFGLNGDIETAKEKMWNWCEGKLVGATTQTMCFGPFQ